MLGNLVGQNAESFVEKHLNESGYETITKNFTCKFGEIDLIMKEGDELIFVEVRSRSHSHFGSAAESVDHAKQRKLLASAQHFLQKNDWAKDFPCRFDVAEVQIGKKMTLNLIEDAFCLDSTFSPV